MAVWTEADRDAIRDALKKLAEGKRRVRVSYTSDAGGSTVEYGQADIPTLERLLNNINASLGGVRRTFYPRTMK